jgi:glycosyltransferase involved in cell wall biosynthesis
VAEVLVFGVPCILVDDGSNLPCAQVLDQLIISNQGKIQLCRHEKNCGKGAAVMTGMAFAANAGYTHALQIDADGQHQVADIPKFLALAASHPSAVIAGHPVYDKSVPLIRLYARYLTHIWVWINTLSFNIKDSMCGFRVYPLSMVTALAARQKIGRRMNFDTEILVRLYWDGVDVFNVPTRVAYPIDGVSHFRVWLDNALITRMHTVLFFGMLMRIPALLVRKRSKR